MKHDEAYNLTEKELARLEARITGIYAEAARDLSEVISDYFEQFKKRDAAQKKLVDEGKITEEKYKQWRLAQIGRGERLKAMRDKVAERMTQVNEVAAAYINDFTPGIYSLNRNYTAYEIEKVVGATDFTLFNESAVRRLIVEQPDLMPYYPPKRAVARGIDHAWGKKQITRQITSSILQGDSIDHMADKLQRRIPEMNRASAVRAARTATTAAQNGGRMDAMLQARDMGIKQRRRWVAVKDLRTRHDHGMADGQVVDMDEPFIVGGEEMMFPGDPSASGANRYNCRCNIRTVEKDGIEAEPRMMRVRDPVTGKSELISEMTYSEWYEWKRSQNPDAFDIAVKKVKNESSDRKQFERYSEVLGKNAPKTFAEFQSLKYTDSEGWEYTKGLVSYLRKYPYSDKRFYDAQQILAQTGIRKGVVLPPLQQQVFILPEGNRDSYHIMRRMAERNITDDDLRGFIRDAKCVFMQWNGRRQLFAGDNGMCVVVQSGENWIYKTAWSKKDYDTESDKIMEVLRSVGL